MKIVNRTPTNLVVQMSGPIGETTALFTLPMAGLKDIVLDMNEVTFINSIGIKHWILWTVKIPHDCVVRMLNCPFVIGTQASIVVGFAKPNMKVETLKVPYICNACGTEHLYLAKMDKDYFYAVGSKAAEILLPESIPCPKCKEAMEQDFIVEKTFKFLTPSSPT